MEKDLQEKILTYRVLEARLDGLLKQRDALVARLIEMQGTIASVQEIEKSDEVLFQIGSQAYTPGKAINKDNIIIEIGAGIALEKTAKEAKETLESRKKEMENFLSEMQGEIETISNTLGPLGQELNELAGKVE